ncbi:MAG: phage/plasmid primase, P4 family [Phycisphaerales bacterium]
MFNESDNTSSSDDPPPTRPSLYDAIPDSLRTYAQWVVWRFEQRDGKRTKVPYAAATGSRASATEPSTWSSFENACAAAEQSHYEGIGFVFTADDPFTGVDLDGCIDDAGVVAPAAQQIIDALNSYTEVSPSGRGVKIFIAGRKPDGVGCKSKAIAGFKETEIYDCNRFFTVTGWHVNGTPSRIEERQDALDALCARLWPKKQKPHLNGTLASAGFGGDDEALIKRACAAKNGDRFARLWAGDTSLHGDDASGADQALCNSLAFWTAKDPERMDRLFRQSGLFRDKWDEKRGGRTYGQMTIEKAIEDCRENYGGGSQHQPSIDRAAPSGALRITLGEPHPITGRLVLCPNRTLPTALAYLREFHQHPDGRTLVAHGGQLLEWKDNRYAVIEEDAIKHRLQPWLHGAIKLIVDPKSDTRKVADFDSNPNTVRNALESIRAEAHIPATIASPSWLSQGDDRPEAKELLPCMSMTLHLPTGRLLPPTPALFTVNALDFDYEADPAPPERWIKFMEEIFGDDIESMETMQEWFGYCLTGDTSQQKMLLLVGPKRSGKGTIGRVLAKLVGAANVAGPTTSSLAGNFGLQPLVDKSLAIVSDARFSGEHSSTVVERLLCISGEDSLTVDRKFLGSVHMKLPTRFFFLSNELPRFRDASAAIASRFIVIELTRSFLGQEDMLLTETLLRELPGILKWAIAGWKRLHARGRFIQPQSAKESLEEIENLASPVSAFVRDHCEVGFGKRADVDDVFEEWKVWCQREGRDFMGCKTAFGRDLAAAVPGIKRRRSTHQIAFYEGIGLRSSPGATL